MGNPRAKATVVLRDPENGAVRVFEKGDQIPNWALDEITNPEVVDLPDADDDGGSDSGSDDSGDNGADGAGDNGADSGAAPANPDDAPPPADEPKPKAPRTRARRTTKSTAK
jgi:hypothetical protein